MPFRFTRADGTVEAGVRRIGCAQIDKALAAIRAADAESAGEMVHAVRRRIKAVRALLRLVRPAFAGFEAENAALRDIGRLLAPARDSRILADTLDDLAARANPPLDAPALARLRRRLTRPAAADQALPECEAALVAARVRAVGWSLGADGWDALGEGFAATLRAARRAMRESGDPHASHEWRKQVKYHWQHMRLLRDVARKPAARRIALAMRLSDRLGDRHDLDLFVETLAAARSRNAAADRLAALAQQRIPRLESKARDIGEALFAAKPRKLAARWGRRWADQARENERV